MVTTDSYSRECGRQAPSWVSILQTSPLVGAPARRIGTAGLVPRPVPRQDLSLGREGGSYLPSSRVSLIWLNKELLAPA